MSEQSVSQALFHSVYFFTQGTSWSRPSVTRHLEIFFFDPTLGRVNCNPEKKGQGPDQKISPSVWHLGVVGTWKLFLLAKKRQVSKETSTRVPSVQKTSGVQHTWRTANSVWQLKASVHIWFLIFFTSVRHENTCLFFSFNFFDQVSDAIFLGQTLGFFCPSVWP